jgi:RNA polymerase sigma factor (sigma-70 family)
MAVVIGHPQRSGAKRTHLERIARGEQGAKLRSQVGAWHPGATRDELDDAFQEACARAERGCHGESEGEVFAWLRTTTHHAVARTHDLARHEGLVAVADRALDDPGESALLPEEQLIEREDRAEIEEVTRSVIARLSDHQRDIAVLHSDGMGRPQIAARLGLSDRSVKRGLERIMAVGRDELVRLAGHGCEPGEDLVARFSFGLADPMEARRAQLHLAGCQRCGELHKRLDLWRENVAAILPVPPAAEQHGAIEHWLHAAADLCSGVKRHVFDAVAQVKQQLSSTYVRAADPTPLAGIRPGAAAAAIAGCLAIGGGATYCAQQGLDPLAGLAGLGSSEQREAPRTHESPRVAASPVAAPAPTTKRSPAVQSTPANTAPPPAPQDEFEPGTAGSPIAATTSSKSSTKPAAASSAGGGEFGGP